MSNSLQSPVITVSIYPKLSSDPRRELHINMLLNAHRGTDAQLNKIFLKYLTNQIITRKTQHLQI